MLITGTDFNRSKKGPLAEFPYHADKRNSKIPRKNVLKNYRVQDILYKILSSFPKLLLATYKFWGEEQKGVGGETEKRIA